MVKIITRKIKGRKYVYLEQAVRMGARVRNISHYLGSAKKLTKKEIEQAKKQFLKELDQRKAVLSTKFLTTKIKQLEYPLTHEEMAKIEVMNSQYGAILQKIHPKNKEDIDKRFIANYVFETNALEGNSLTLKNVAEIIFEGRLSQGKDLREVYDAQNAYNSYLFLQKTRKPLSDQFIIALHTLLMKNIDDRLGYRTIPIILLGKPQNYLTSASDVPGCMDSLLKWYEQNQETMHPLELAFKFHAKFEKIHPFCDGNGRVGRLLINYILLRKGYFPIIIRKTQRNQYIKALESADRKKWVSLMRFALKNYKRTFRQFFEVYYKHV